MVDAMPRLTTQRYIAIHYMLQQHWFSDPLPFSFLTPNEQWDLHEYFQDYKRLTTAELMAHRKVMSRQAPSLPQCAGRALRHFERVVDSLRAGHSPAQVGRTDGQAIEIYPLVEPEIDYRRLARALIGLAKISTSLLVLIGIMRCMPLT